MFKDMRRGNACKPHKLKRRLEHEVESHLVSTSFPIFLELGADEVKAHLVSRQILECFSASCHYTEVTKDEPSKRVRGFSPFNPKSFTWTRLNDFLPGVLDELPGTIVSGYLDEFPENFWLYTSVVPKFLVPTLAQFIRPCQQKTVHKSLFSFWENK